MEAGTILCKNCGQNTAGAYCSHCGQSSDVHRVTWHEIAHHLPHAMFHVDGGLWFTIKELALRPGHSAREYLFGRRKPHYNPFLLLLMSAGLCSLLFAYFHIPTMFARVELHNVAQQSATLAHKFFAIRMAFFCLLCSIGDSLLFRKAGYAFPELVIFNTFSFCGVSIIQLLFVPFFIIANLGELVPWLHGAMLLSVMLYLWWVRIQFFEVNNNRHYRWLIALALLAYLAVIAWLGQSVVQPLLHLIQK